MIDREIIRNPDKPFDFFNDYEDTSYWLYKLEIGKLNPDATKVSKILEQRLTEYNETAKYPIPSQRTNQVNQRKIDDYGFPLSPHELMCEARSCNNKATTECEQIPGTAEPGWENEPTARCDEHSKGLIVTSTLKDTNQC